MAIFLNYTQADRDAAERLRAWLDAEHYSVWSDRDLELGADFAAEIRKQISQAEAILTIWSQRSVRSAWVRAEVQFALDRGIRLIAIQIDNAPIPMPFNVYQTTLITDWNRDLEQLRDILDESVGRKSKPLPSPNSAESAAWQRAKDDSDPARLAAFLQAFPRSGYAEAARERLASIAWERLRNSDDVTALQQFAAEFSGTAAADHASKRLILLRQPTIGAPSRLKLTAPLGWKVATILARLAFPAFGLTPLAPSRAPSASSRAPDVFISYRREDSSDITGRMFDRLVSAYDRNRIFKDVDSMPLGVDFRDYITSILETCSMCLVVIGRDWLGQNPESGVRRIDELKDFVRIEIEAALKNGIPVIPVFVHGSSMPPEEKLPKTISALAFRNGMELRPDPNFHTDMDRLIGGMALYRDTARQRLQ